MRKKKEKVRRKLKFTPQIVAVVLNLVLGGLCGEPEESVGLGRDDAVPDSHLVLRLRDKYKLESLMQRGTYEDTIVILNCNKDEKLLRIPSPNRSQIFTS
jgi:hypothetical protein